ncbi:hypothetical protein, partial [uncultured Leuconostoc sp.]|uniref:hypothetical protein n=1 Tax=uncultured Leuconostoc sp. TaxID=173262 RepID=UPI0025929CAB
MLTIGQTATAAGITPTYQTTPTGTSPTAAWTMPGQADVINPQGGFQIFVLPPQIWRFFVLFV